MNVQQVLDRIEREEHLPETGIVFGEPVHHGERVVIPVARVRRIYGWGAGEGKGGSQPVETGEGWGAGQGGIVSARPVAVVEVTPDRTRVIPVPDVTRLALMAMLLAAWNVFWITRALRLVRGRQG